MLEQRAPTDEVPKAIGRLASRDNVREVVLISTCNRTEVYAVTERFHGAYAEIRDFLARSAPSRLTSCTTSRSHHDEAAVRHLFQVAAGLESAVWESPRSSVRCAAWETAQIEGGGPVLNLLFRHAVVVGKRAARRPASAGHLRQSRRGRMTVEHLDGLEGMRVAWSSALGRWVRAWSALPAAGGHCRIVNRTPARDAWRNVSAVRPSGWISREVAPDQRDVVITSTGSGRPLVDR